MVIGMNEVLACRITGNEGGTADFTRAPAQVEIEDQLMRSHDVLHQWRDAMSVMEEHLNLLAQASPVDQDALRRMREIHESLRQNKPVVKDYHKLMSARAIDEGWNSTTRVTSCPRCGVLLHTMLI